MATILKSDIVNEAMRELGVLTPNDLPEPEDQEKLFYTLERMIARYQTALTGIGYVLGDDISAESGLLQQYEQDVIIMLARESLRYFGIPLSDPLAGDSDEAKGRIDAACLSIPELQRHELQPRGAGRTTGWPWADRFYVNGETDGAIP